MKTVLILSSCDAWHSYGSFRTIGIFSNIKTLVGYLKKYDKLSEWDIEQITTIGQTQCRKVNYCVEKQNVNPKYNKQG
jgi:hypothetical protein